MLVNTCITINPTTITFTTTTKYGTQVNDPTIR